MKRQTRVPASTVVRMNSASNRMAKWYQMPISSLPPKMPDRMLRHADRERRRAAGARQDGQSRRRHGRPGVSWSGVTTKPQSDITCAACAAVVPISPPGLFMAK